MNEKVSNDDMVFDRLVDGELSTSERRSLLESLDARPDGWRRCALAFLEAQAWRQELGLLARSPHPENHQNDSSRTPAPFLAVPVNSAKKNPARSVMNRQWFGVPPAILVAFGLGWMQH